MLSRTRTRSSAFLGARATPCPFARPPPVLLRRGKRTKASYPDGSEHDATTKSKPSLLGRLRGSRSIFEDDTKMDQAMRPLSDAELERDDLPVINWYEQDLDKGTPQRLIERIATPEDRKKDRDMYLMIEESRKNPDHDDATLNRRLIDSLLTNPNFAELTDELQLIKKGIKSREELQQLKQQGAVKAEAESKQFNAGLRMATLEILQDVLEDPDIGDAKADLQACIDHMPEVENIDNPVFQAMLNKAMHKLEGNEAMQNKVAAMRKRPDSELEREWQTYQRETEDAIAQAETPNEDLTMATPEDMQDVDKLLHQMRDVMKSLGGDTGLEAELDAAINEDSTSGQDEEGVFEREMDPQELAEELKKLAQSKASQPGELVEEDEEDVPAELQAKVDEIMKDPKLMEKLMYIQKLISENRQQQGHLTSIAHETAPDPYQLADSRTAPLSERMAAALQDPEHVAALQRLRVDLPPPFNIAPALKSFNKAIELAYIGANDDIRRILWRSYQKARSLPTFLQNIGDEAWDILYYSQAVTWGSNQNRENHLRMLLADLESIGRDGPPTHPSTLADGGVEQLNT